MGFKTQFGLLAVMTLTSAAVSGEKFLAVKPDFLIPCKQIEPGFNNCFAKDFQAAFTNWNDGIPGLKSFGSFDPMYVKRVVITDGGNNPISLNMELTNLKFTGLKHSNFKDASYDHAKSLTKLRMFVPTVQINADYDMKGRVLALPLNGKGKTKINIENLGIDIAIRLKIRKENGFLFTDVDKLRLEIIEVGNFQINLENLFNGQKDLEASAHALFNNNWMELYEFLKPSITSTIQALMKDRLEKMFAFVPATYFIEDLVYGS